MSDLFFEKPILNSPYEYPSRHWELDEKGQPTQRIIDHRRPADFITPIPKSKKQRTSDQPELALDYGSISDQEQNYDLKSIINEVRGYVDQWRRLPNSNDWLVTPETARLLKDSHRIGSSTSVSLRYIYRGGESTSSKSSTAMVG